MWPRIGLRLCATDKREPVGFNPAGSGFCKSVKLSEDASGRLIYPKMLRDVYLSEDASALQQDDERSDGVDG